VCLNARHPRLHIYAPSSGYEAFGEFILFVCIFAAGTGTLLVLRAIAACVLVHFFDNRSPRIFPEMALQNVIPRKQHGQTAGIKGLPNFGLMFGCVLWILMFIFAIERPWSPQGLLVDFRKPQAAGVEKSPWTETVSVYVDAQRKFIVNGQAVSGEELRTKLKKELSRQMVWTVYLEADSDCPFMDVLHAMDTIQGLGAKLVWITPKTREEWSHKSAR